jgi:hypothetical protein
MLSQKIHLATAFFIFFVLSSAPHSFGKEKQKKTAYWGASGTAFCHNYENISIWVGMSYVHQDEALTELWSRAVTVCQAKGGLYDVSGAAYPHQGASWNM